MKVKNAIKKAVGLSTVTMMLSANILFTGNFLVEELISYALDTEHSGQNQIQEIQIQENKENVTLSAEQILVSNFLEENEKKNIIQTKVRVNLSGNTYKPQTMQITMPKDIIPNAYPNQIYVRSLKNRNFETLELDTTENITITASNLVVEEAVEGAEEFLVTYIYENAEQNAQNIELTINSISVTLLGGIELDPIENQTTALETTEVRGNGIELNSVLESFGIGRLSAGQEQNFEETTTIQMEPEMLADGKIVIEDFGNRIYSNNEIESVLTEVNPIFLNTVINQEDLLNFLGDGYKIELVQEEIQEEATVETVIDEYTDIMATIQPITEEQTEEIEQTEEQELITAVEENIIITYPENTNKFKLRLSKGEKGQKEILSGELNLKTLKQIPVQPKEVAESLGIIYSNIRTSIQNINTELNLETINGMEIQGIKSQATIEVLNPQNGENTFPAGENIANVSIILNTVNSASKLYTNPVIEIQPIEGIEINKITNVSITNNGVQEQPIFTAQVQEIEGKNVINLTGSQTQYNSQLENVTINFEMVIKTETEIINMIDKPIVAKIVNNYNDVQETIFVQDTINIQAEEKLFINHNITATENIAVGANNITIGKTSENQTIRIENTLKNNTTETKENVIIYGKMPLMAQGATILEATAQTAKIYFTANEEATQDITVSENGWAELANIADQAQIKQYLIVLNQLESAQTEKTTIKLNIPAEIPENQKSTYTRNVEINGAAQGETQTIECYTPSQVDVSATILADKETYSQGEEITYSIEIKNNNTITAATGINISSILPANLEAIGETNWANINILPGATLEKTIKMKIPENVEPGEITAEINITANGLETPINLSKTVEIKVEPVKIETEYFLGSEYFPEDREILKQGDTINYFIKIYNQTANLDIENLKVLYDSEDISLSTAGVSDTGTEDWIGVSFPEDGKSALFEGKVRAGNLCVLKCIGQVREIYNENEITANVVIEYDYNGEHIVKEITEEFPTAIPAKIVATMESNKAGAELKLGDEIEYTLTVKNEGETATRVEISTSVPKELIIQKIIQESNGVIQESNSEYNDVVYSRNFEGGEVFKIRFLCIVQNATENVTIENFAQISGNDIEEIETNKITNTIIVEEPDDEGPNGDEPNGDEPNGDEPNGDDPSGDEPNGDEPNGDEPNGDEPNGDEPNGDKPNGDEPNDNKPGIELPDEEFDEGEDANTFTISGQAWIDKDKNGVKDAKEAYLKGIVVKILNVETGEYVKTTTGEILTQITGDEGEYAFTALKPGKYIIEFEYNKDTYDLVAPTQSIQISKISTEQGIKTRSEVINVQNSNISNVNIPLSVKNQRFDLALDKYVTKITVTNQKNTTIYENLKTNLAKIEIDKKHMVGSKVAIEYTIEVTNQGNIAGTVNKIVDYIPDGMEFNSELNTNWYQDNDGNLYSTALAKKEIAAGETQTIKLVLTKTIGSTSKVDIKNTAEIQEHYNKELLNDKDSTPANRQIEEDDQSTAELIISIKTGAVTYTILIITCGVILLAGTIVIKKYVV